MASHECPGFLVCPHGAFERFLRDRIMKKVNARFLKVAKAAAPSRLSAVIKKSGR